MSGGTRFALEGYEVLPLPPCLTNGSLMDRTILLYEPRPERVAHLVFLFNLADIRCTQARTVEETLNWLTAMRLEIVNFDLIMIGSLLGVPAEEHLFTELRQVSLPMIFLQSPGESCPEALEGRTMVCRPDDMLHCLEECLGTSDGKISSRELPAVRRMVGNTR